MKIIDTISLAFRTVRGNKLRTGITVAIIAFGIMALVGINTAIDAMTQKFTESFASMGANGFTIHYREYRIRFGGDDSETKKEKKGQRKEKKSNNGKPITRDQAESFKNRFNFPSKIALTLQGSNNSIVSMGDKKTSPNVRINGGDENYIEFNGYSLAAGRNLNAIDVGSGRNVCLIGTDVSKKIFGSVNPEIPLEKIIKINGVPYRVVGTLESKGSTLGMSWDNVVITSYNNVRRFFNSNNSSFNIQVKVQDVKLLDAAIGEAEGVFRPIRRLATTEEANFMIDKSDAIVNLLMKNLSFITISAVIIGFITLVGAAVGLMNIMLVSVSERTKEIGLIKAIGGRQKSVRRQFLYESIIISLLGAIFGILLGVLLGNVFSLILSTGFVVPWEWLGGGIIICSLVGLGAGLYPSIKASRLNPIEALRYE